MIRFIFAFVIFIFSFTDASTHTVHYKVEQKGISVRIFYEGDNPASYAGYEIFGPGDTINHQNGRSDKNGFVSFLPDRPGKWKIKVSDESDHGIHGVNVEIDVNEGLFLESYKKPLVATYTRMFIGAGLILGIFGIWAILRLRAERRK